MILNRYLFKEIALSFFATLLVLSLIIIGNTFVRLLANASNGNLPVDLLGGLLSYGSLKTLIRLTPVALLIGMMLAFSRLYRDSEMVALQAAGVGPKQFYRAIFSFVLPLSLLMALAVLWLAPRLEQNHESLLREVQQRPEAAGIPAGQFVTTGNKTKNYTILAESIDESRTVMEKFFVRLQQDKSEVLVWARSAMLFIDSVTGERFLQIRDGYRYENDPERGGMTVVRFAEHGIRIPLRNFDKAPELASLPTSTLLSMNDNAAWIELQWRLSVILTTPVLAFIAFPLSYTKPRQGRYSKVAWAILLYGLYANALITARGFLDDGKLPMWLGLWWVHIIVIAIGLWFLRQYYGKPA
ncbi:LPS export ABC transporter permease LptF [Thiolinea disciformis]|uniref:LPS export ABC transporter permease LptF n=1 Tax=Thiolinea disciformis TaxID=125614 RepID=UPI000366EF99|nr:LPS export ABC transporter permease LptF [Thiolinea disciformis]